MTEAATLLPANPAQRGAYQAGYAARLVGRSRFANPYDPAVGWRATFAAAWSDGWLAADEAVEPGFIVTVPEEEEP